MATTTPTFGWSVPTSTDYVKDGATAIETLGDSIDSSLAKAALQVVTANKTTAFSTTSTSYVDVTGLSVTITPRSSNSKILVMLSAPASNGSTADIYFQLLRGATQLGTVDAYYSYVANIYQTMPVNCIYLDSPATTAATTYKAQFKVSGGTGYVGRPGGAAVPLISSITAIELAG